MFHFIDREAEVRGGDFPNNSLLLLIAEQYYALWILSQFLYSPAEGLDYFQFVIIINKATINICIQVFV